jgi:CheY-like chemotaxis protein
MKMLELLVVDDEPVNRKMACLMLTHEGHAVTVASDGREAVEMCLIQPFDAVVMDVQMPRLNGVEAIRTLRADGRTKHLPIVSFSANTDWLEAVMEAGADGFLKKPFKRLELLRAIRSAMAERARITSVERHR